MSRTKLLPLCVPALALLVLVPLAARAQGGKGRTVHGTVTDAQHRPISYALVSPPKGTKQITDDSGHFDLQLSDKKKLTLDVRRVGYDAASLAIDAGEDTTVSVQLSSHSGGGSAPSAKLQNSGFYDRMRAALNGSGPGRFISAEEIEQRKFPRITNLIDGTPGVRIQRGGSIGGVPTGSSSCLMETYVDGTRSKLFVPAGGAAGGSSMINNVERANTQSVQLDPSSDGLDNTISSSNVLGIEIYSRPAEAPGKFQSMSGTCGVIVIWLK